MVKLEQKTSITIVENKKVTCGNCLISESANHPEMVNCNLNPEPVLKHITAFCANGLWLYNGNVIDFRNAFKQVYDNIGKKNDKELKGGE